MKNRTGKASFSILVFFTALLASCDNTKLVESWAKQEGNPLRVKKVVAMAITKDATRRRAMEDAMVTEIRKYRVEATPSYQILEGERVRNNDAARDAIKSAGFDGAVSLHLVSTRTEQHYQPGRWTYSAFPAYYRTFWGYYRQAWPRVYEPGYLTSEKVVAAESMVYDLNRDELVWSGISETTNPESIDKFIRGVAKAVASDMKKKGILQPATS